MDQSFTSLSKEKRLFKPSKNFSENAYIKKFSEYEKLYKSSIKNPDKFWSSVASELHWFKKWKKVSSWKAPHCKWFTGGKINLSYNCLDRHIENGRKNKVALFFEGEPGDTRTLTYYQLYIEVNKFANVLKNNGIKKGDKVCIYMPMVPEAVIAILACARIGAVHSVVFAGFSSQALIDRINDANAKMVITADGCYRRGQIIKLKDAVDNALPQCDSVKSVIVLKRTNNEISFDDLRDKWWHIEMKDVNEYCKPEKLDSEHPLYILYTSGSTGKPKGILHTTGGYSVQTYLTTKVIFDIKDDDVYWCTADIGWVTGHSYVVYGPLQNGASVFIYEGAPNYPEPDRFWNLIDKYKVNIFYTAPTAIRAFIKWGNHWVEKYSLKSLRLLGTVGEPINPEAWMWYNKMIGKENCPIVDTWWQTETGAIMIAPVPGAVPTKPGSATLPFFGIEPQIVDKSGKPVKKGDGGFLIMKKPWPSMLRTIWGDDERFKKQYFSDFPGYYFTGDGARQDKDGYYWVMGRVDDVINVSGHRLGTAEIESALVAHPKVAESAVVGKPDEIKGSSICAFVSLESSHTPSDDLKQELKNWVVKEIGALARPDEIRFTDALPKTRSGKIMRRLLRELANSGEVKGDVTTLEDFTILEKLRQSEEEE
ncbi:MAG TPA: acetate--CoA ligase [Bacteroidetes bacterium]|nr:acetate--CoA ligase [Bacteroidota bacterium]HCN36155.1 acetate--CoA ligase [Bacteroidota bacterium]